ncbi:centrosomal protein of 85 kDa [Pelobates fuscus]|uniref:centrosomal protein of 85 kDa n=1 Tax=Pelobates fuscus TaxID=191477 RepID=UPI002FE48D69
MATLERFKDMAYPRADTAPLQTGSLSHTDWQTPFVSGKSVSRISESKREDCVPSESTCPENLKDFCSANGSSSFEPIRSQITIPTAHILPSTLGKHSTNACELGGAQTLTDSNPHSFPFQPSSNLLAADELRKFEVPNIEPTLNQSSLLQTLYTDQKPNALTEGNHIDGWPYRILPQSKESANVGHIRSVGNTHLISRGWKPELFSLHSGAEFSALRQQHQMDNIRLEMEQLQLARGRPTPVYPDHNGLGRVLKTNENVLLEELLVERQRQHFSQLEQKLRENEVQVRNTMLSPVNPYSEMYMIRLQELQREVTFLRAQFTEKNDSFSREKAELEKKLGACEMEANELKESRKKLSQNHSEELRKQEERVKARDRHINALKKKCQKESEQNKEKQERIETLERYLSDLPTVQDHRKQTQELNDLKEKSCLLQNQVHEVETKLGDVRAFCREKESQLINEKGRGQELLNIINRLQEELERSKEPGHHEEEKKQLTQEIENLRQEVQTLRNEKECLKKVMESQKKKMEQLCSRVKELEEQVSQEVGTGQVLKEETQKKENAFQQLKEAVKELAVQNQDLMERNVLLEEHLQQTRVGEQQSSLEVQALFSLYREMNVCLKDLKSICNLLCQRVQGVDPNLSMLLGIHSTPSSADYGEILDSSSLDKHLVDVRQLKRDIDDLRITISDRYAQDMGDNCITQ